LVKLPAEKIKERLIEYCENIYKIKTEWNASANGAGFTCWDDLNFGFVKQGICLDTREIKKKLEDRTS
jgi:hypothetical protein